MAWRRTRRRRRTGADFWNVKDFPGKRSLPNFPAYMLPAALMADGVTADKLYPIDLDRAFKRLDKIKKDIRSGGRRAPSRRSC